MHIPRQETQSDHQKSYLISFMSYKIHSSRISAERVRATSVDVRQDIRSSYTTSDYVYSTFSQEETRTLLSYCA